MSANERRTRSLSARIAVAGLALWGAAASGTALAATSAGCEGGGFTVLGLSGPQDTSVPAASVPAVFRVQGKYVQFDVDARSFGVRNYAFTGAPNPLDMTGQTFTPVFESKLPDHRGLVLTGAVLVESDGETLSIFREGQGVSMKIQANDCAKGGLMQMEVERADGTTTRFTHTLATPGGQLTPFYFDNRNFRNREGDTVPYKDTTVVVPARINFANDFSRKFVGRDSPQVATRVNEPACTNQIVRRDGTTVPVQHCGGVSKWDVASGGRMGAVFGDDSVEVAPPATNCTHQCQAQNRVRGQAVVLGFPFPVADADRLKPRFP